MKTTSSTPSTRWPTPGCFLVRLSRTGVDRLRRPREISDRREGAGPAAAGRRDRRRRRGGGRRRRVRDLDFRRRPHLRHDDRITKIAFPNLHRVLYAREEEPSEAELKAAVHAELERLVNADWRKAARARRTDLIGQIAQQMRAPARQIESILRRAGQLEEPTPPPAGRSSQDRGEWAETEAHPRVMPRVGNGCGQEDRKHLERARKLSHDDMLGA